MGMVAAVLLFLSVLDIQPRLFGMTPKDSLLVLELGVLLIGIICSLSILCIAQAQALKRLGVNR